LVTPAAASNLPKNGVLSPANSQTADLSTSDPTSTPTLSLFNGYPLLERIAACETTGSVTGTPRQFLPDGSILWGIDPKTHKRIQRDEGILQINTWVWQASATQMGDNLNTLEGNLAFGKYLYQKYGTAPWSASEGCWSGQR
jgi:hypothetical protein